MSIIKTKKTIIYGLTIAFLLVAVSALNRCRILPWKTTRFCSCSEYLKLDHIGGFNKLVRFYPDSECNGIFMVTISKGDDERMYSTKNPFAFRFYFCHYVPDIKTVIKTVRIENERGQEFHVALKLPVEVSTKRVRNYKDYNLDEYVESECFEGLIETEYAYAFEDFERVYIEMEVEVSNAGQKETKLLKQELLKEQEWGVFQYGF